MNERRLRELVARKLAKGVLLARGPWEVWAGIPSGETCAVCGRSIEPRALEIDAVCADGTRRFYHGDCYRILWEERRRARLRPRHAAPARPRRVAKQARNPTQYRTELAS